MPSPAVPASQTSGPAGAAADAAPPVFIVIRRTIDWSDPGAVAAELRGDLRPKVALWNAMFNLPYERFRARLKEIALLNFARVLSARVVPPEAVPAGALAAPVDDDDWFSPDLARNLAAAWEPGKLGYVWNRFVLEARPQRNPLRWLMGRGPGDATQADHSRYTCGSNNYAVSHVNAWLESSLTHTRASRHFDTHPAQVRRLPATLSIQNRTLASQTMLNYKRPTLSSFRLRRRYRRYLGLYENLRLPGELAWAEPYVGMMAELMRELRCRD